MELVCESHVLTNFCDVLICSKQELLCFDHANLFEVDHVGGVGQELKNIKKPGTGKINLGADIASVIVPKTIYVFIGFVIGQLVDNFFSQPYIFSKSVKSHPLEIFLIIILNSWNR